MALPQTHEHTYKPSELNPTSYRPLNELLSSMQAEVLKIEYIQTDTNIVGKKNLDRVIVGKKNLDRVNKERKDLGYLQNEQLNMCASNLD